MSNPANVARVLLVEDDEIFALLLQRTFSKSGLDVEVAPDIPGVSARVQTGNFDALIVDGNLPSGDGFELCRELRPLYGGVIILLTGRDDDLDELMGLRLGADDYVRKPVEPRLVLARLQAHLRRQSRAAKSAPNGAVMVFGPISIHPELREVRREGALLTLTDAEFDLLTTLAARAGEIVGRDTLFQGARGVEYDGLDRSIDMRVSRLRKLLGDDPAQPRIIKTVRGRGYMFVRFSGAP